MSCHFKSGQLQWRPKDRSQDPGRSYFLADVNTLHCSCGSDDHYSGSFAAQGPHQKQGWLQSMIRVERGASWLWTRGRSNWSRASSLNKRAGHSWYIFKVSSVQSIILKSSEDGHWMSTTPGPQKATVPETLEIAVFLLLFSQHIYSFNSFYPLCVCDWKVFSFFVNFVLQYS